MSSIKMSSFSTVDTTARHPVGTRAEDEYGNPHMYCKQVGATTSAVGEWANVSTTGTIGTVSRTAATSLINAVSTVALAAGVFRGAAATDTFCWVQIGGVGQEALTTDTGIAAGDPLVIDGGATAVGATDTMADGEEESCCGFAFTADSGAVQPAGSYSIRSVWL